MTGPHKDFTFEIAEVTDEPGPTFTLTGDADQFHCVASPSPGLLYDTLRELREDKRFSALPFLRGVLLEGAETKDRERFETLVYSQTISIPGEVLTEIASWLLEHYLKRPLGSRSSSDGGSTMPEGSSTGSASQGG